MSIHSLSWRHKRTHSESYNTSSAAANLLWMFNELRAAVQAGLKAFKKSSLLIWLCSSCIQIFTLCSYVCFNSEKQLTFNDCSRYDKCSDIHKIIIVLFRQNQLNSEIMWLLWSFKINSQYCSTVHTFVCSLNTVLSQIRSILSMIHSFSLTAIIYCDDIASYHTAWCILSTKIIIESKAQSLMLIAFTTVTYSWFSDCVTNAFSALYDSVITLTVSITLIWNPVLSKL